MWNWGTPIAWDVEGRPIAFVLDRTPNETGDEVITNVTWAPNAPDVDVPSEPEPLQHDQY